MGDPNALTLTGLLQDPLTRMVMRSDGVTETDFSDLMLRVKNLLLARQDPAVPNPPDCGVVANHEAAARFRQHAFYQFQQ